LSVPGLTIFRDIQHIAEIEDDGPRRISFQDRCQRSLQVHTGPVEQRLHPDKACTVDVGRVVIDEHTLRGTHTQGTRHRAVCLRLRLHQPGQRRDMHRVKGVVHFELVVQAILQVGHGIRQHSNAVSRAPQRPDQRQQPCINLLIRPEIPAELVPFGFWQAQALAHRLPERIGRDLAALSRDKQVTGENAPFQFFRVKREPGRPCPAHHGVGTLGQHPGEIKDHSSDHLRSSSDDPATVSAGSDSGAIVRLSPTGLQ
jgi:hypothetical protein